MRVGILTYPMLFQRDSALRSELRALLAAFERMRPTSLYGQVEVSLIDARSECLDDFDLVHVVGARHGNHQAVACAAACGMPVVLTADLGADWRHADNVGARLADWLLGRAAHSRAHGEHAQIGTALRQATLVLAQSREERAAIADAFAVKPSKMRLLAAGIDRGWFEADAALFRQRTGMHGQFALMSGPLGSAAQCAAACSLGEMALPLVVIGSSTGGDAVGLRQLRAMPGVRVMADLADQPRLLASVFAAASMYLLAGAADAGGAWRRGSAGHAFGGRRASEGELRGAGGPGGGLASDSGAGRGVRATVRPTDTSGAACARCNADSDALPSGAAGALAALAAGTAVLCDTSYRLDVADAAYGVKPVRWQDSRRRKAAIIALLEAPPVRERLRALVRGYGWDHVAARLSHCYADAIALHGPAPNVFVGTAGVRQLLTRVAR